MEFGLDDKVALVTGAWRGTGRGIATVLAEEGARVWLHGFELEPAEREAAALRAEGCDVRAVAGDITSDAGAAQVCEAVLRGGGRIDVLVNNYGVAEGPGWLDGTSDDWIQSYQRNVLAGVRLVRALVPGMRERGFGRVIFVGTVGSLRPGARTPHYYAAKAALPNLTVGLAKELAGTGITVNTVSPGIIATDEVRESFRRTRREARLERRRRRARTARAWRSSCRTRARARGASRRWARSWRSSPAATRATSTARTCASTAARPTRRCESMLGCTGRPDDSLGVDSGCTGRADVPSLRRGLEARLDGCGLSSSCHAVRMSLRYVIAATPARANASRPAVAALGAHRCRPGRMRRRHRPATGRLHTASRGTSSAPSAISRSIVASSSRSRFWQISRVCSPSLGAWRSTTSCVPVARNAGPSNAIRPASC